VAVVVVDVGGVGVGALVVVGEALVVVEPEEEAGVAAGPAVEQPPSSPAARTTATGVEARIYNGNSVSRMRTARPRSSARSRTSRRGSGRS